jgi:tellurite methyltransferase
MQEAAVMQKILSANIARRRREQGMTQEQLATKLGITYQAVSKWETGQALPDITLLPTLAQTLNVSVDKLLGYDAGNYELSPYESEYQKDEYYWGFEPSTMCLKVLELLPPVRHLKLLDIGCGEGKDAVFFARCGYEVSAFDISDAGIEKAKRLAEKSRVKVRVFKANIWDFRLDEKYDILYSSGVLAYIKPELRDEIMENYKTHVADDGLAAFHVFVHKPFVPRAPEKEKYSWQWKSGELFTYFHDWLIKHCTEYIFDCNSSGIPHKHAANRLFAKNLKEPLK